MFQTHALARAMLAGALGTLAMATTPAIAQTAVAPKDANVGDVATTPSKRSTSRRRISPLLLQARQAPYSLVGLKSCAALSDEVRKLDAVLGDDIDVSDYSQKVLRVGNTAKSIVGSLIPFNGIIRQVSGANESQRQWQVALYAGTARRAFLKGTGLARGCPYPARPARASDYELLRAQRDAQAQQAAEDKRRR
jgi:hypothetical protein